MGPVACICQPATKRESTLQAPRDPIRPPRGMVAGTAPGVRNWGRRLYDPSLIQMVKRFEASIGPDWFVVNGSREAENCFLPNKEGFMSLDIVKNLHEIASASEEAHQEVFLLASGFCRTMREVVDEPLRDYPDLNGPTLCYISEESNEEVVVCLWNGYCLRNIVKLVANCSPSVPVFFVVLLWLLLVSVLDAAHVPFSRA